jgi:hypothetical protein
MDPSLSFLSLQYNDDKDDKDEAMKVERKNTTRQIQITCKNTIQKITKRRQKRAIVQKWNLRNIKNDASNIQGRDNNENDDNEKRDNYGEKNNEIQTNKDNNYNLNAYNLILRDHLTPTLTQILDNGINADNNIDNNIENNNKHRTKIMKNNENNENNNIENLFGNHNLQFNILSDLYMNYDPSHVGMRERLDTNTEHTEQTQLQTSSSVERRREKTMTTQYKVMLQELNKKLRGYQYQDIQKKRLDREKLISLNECIELLLKQRLRCAYCSHEVFVIYQYIREPFQWSLDRINNEEGHNRENCVVGCLKCNLQRRRINDKKFMFTKKMKIIFNG